MDKLFLTVLNMSLTGAFVIAAICLARLPLKKAPKIISYCLWAVAGFRLVFPYSIESIFSLMPIKPQPIPTDIAMQTVPRIDSGIPFMNNAVSSVLPAAAPANSVNPLQIWTFIGSWVWIIVVVAMLVYGVVSFLILKRKMQSAAHIEANIYEAENLKSPFVLGIFKPKIYLPVGLSENEREYILLHEQTHIKRRDHIIKFGAYFILCLHWFNPLAWIAFLLMGADMEMSCDERVLKDLGNNICDDYSMSLVRVATGRRILNGSPLAFGEGGMKERIKRILNFKKPSRVIVVAAVALVAVLNVGFAVNRINMVDRAFPMEGINLSDLQTDSIMQSVAGIVGADADNIYVPDYNNFQIQVTDNFDWQLSGTVSMIYAKSKSYYHCQLRIFSDESEFYVTEPERREAPQRQFHLSDYLNALRYLPQEYIRSLSFSSPDGYIINFVDGGVPNDGQPCVFYNSSGMTDENGWFVRFDILPMYRDEDGSGYHGVGSDVIHVFYGGEETAGLRQMTLDEVRELAAKGDALQYSDFPNLRPSLLSSTMGGYNPTLYGVEGGYRLLLNFNETVKPESGIRSVMLESIWESGGSGIDIRYSDVDEFIRTHPSHPAIIGEAAWSIAEAYVGKPLTLIDVDWWEYADEFPHNPKDPFKQTLRESLDAIESCELFMDEDGGFIAVGREFGTLYVYSDGVWVLATDNNVPTGTTPPEILDKIYLGMTNTEVYELFGEPDYHASGLMWFGYNNIGTFNPASDFGYADFNGKSDFIVRFGSWSIYDLVDASIKQHYADDTPSGEYPTQSHVLYLQSADKNGFTVWLISLYQTYIPDGEYNVRLARSSSMPLELSFEKNVNSDYVLTSYRERSGEWPVGTPPNTEQLENNCYTDAMYHFIGTIPNSGRYTVGAGVAVLTGVADDTADPGCFNIKYFPGATLQIEPSENELEYTMAKPNSWIIEYADSSKNIIVSKDGTGVIPITDDLIGICNTDSGQYTMKFEKYRRTE